MLEAEEFFFERSHDGIPIAIGFEIDHHFVVVDIVLSSSILTNRTFEHVDLRFVVVDTSKENHRQDVVGGDGSPAPEQLRDETLERLFVVDLAIFVKLPHLSRQLDEEIVLCRL